MTCKIIQILQGIDMRDFTPNREWKVVSVNATKRVQKYKGMLDSFPSMIFDIVLERHSVSLQATAIAPIVCEYISTTTGSNNYVIKV